MTLISKYFSGLLLIFVGIGFSQKLNIDSLIVEALNNNPQLKSAGHTVFADEAVIKQAGALPDPILALNILNLPVDNFVFDQEPMTGKQIALKQGFPFPGKLGLKEEIAAYQARISRLKYNEIKNRLIYDLKVSFYDLYFVEQSIATITKNEILLKQFEKIAQTKYSVGQGLQQDVLKAQVELSRMIERLITLKQKRSQIESRMNTLLNRPAENHLASAPQIQFDKYLLNRDSLKIWISEERPLLKAWGLKKTQSIKKTDLAKKSYWPDFGLSLAYTQRDVLQNGMGGVDFISGGLSFNIPLYFWKKQNKAVEEFTLRSQAVGESYQNVYNEIMNALEKTFTNIEKNSALADLYKNGIVPQATQSLQSAMIGYQTDKVDFLTLINNQLTLFNLELEYTRIISAYKKNLAELELILGIQLDEKGLFGSQEYN